MILAGTGHRPNKLGGYSDIVFNRLVKLSEYALSILKPDIVISGMALGFDQALAQAAINLNIPLHAYVAFNGQDSSWPLASRNRFNNILSQSARILYVCPPGYEAYKLQRRNEAMVENSNLLLALWNGDTEHSGTYNCIKYARSVERKIINIWKYYAANYQHNREVA